MNANNMITREQFDQAINEIMDKVKLLTLKTDTFTSLGALVLEESRKLREEQVDLRLRIEEFETWPKSETPNKGECEKFFLKHSHI